ncbi:uncharacterized protein LOC111715828 [Eurytemora carolleeae]|uniref:uncharacterized protein LOC111715828 n=1 Tax=Eurytemora carolleeae TaxID=1294199 RepID=UPI000C75AE76|nr:uncharacterized protein LOC111715828 [Eurytemora carolleeae]|eukprot:XP_023346980.1 uncharacterized protein LOC111715828 [Eurytemora affinis]
MTQYTNLSRSPELVKAEGVVSRNFKKKIMLVSALDLKPYHGTDVEDPQHCAFIYLSRIGKDENTLFTFQNDTCFLGKHRDIERRIVEAGLQTTNNTLRVWQEDFPTCQIPEDPLNGRFDCYMNIRTEKCFLVCTPGFVPRLYRGTYCKEKGKTGEWNVSISSMDCIPTTTIFVTGGIFKDLLDRVFKPYQPEELRYRTGTWFYRPTAQYFRGKLLLSGGFHTKNMMHNYDSSSKALNPYLNLKSFHEIGTTVVVHDKLYTLGPYTNLAEYYQENNEGKTFAGPILQSTGFYRCAVSGPLEIMSKHRSSPTPVQLIALHTASPTIDEDVPEETLDAQAGPIDRATGVIEQLTYPRQSSPTKVQLVQLQVQTNSPDVPRDRNTGESPAYIDRRELDCLANTSGAAPYYTEDSIQDSDIVCGLEQLEYQYRSMTPGEEDISMIYEDKIYHPPDMNEIIQDTRCYTILGLEMIWCSSQTALHRPVVIAAGNVVEPSQLVGASQIVGATVDIVDISHNLGAAVDIVDICQTLGAAVDIVDISHTLGAVVDIVDIYYTLGAVVNSMDTSQLLGASQMVGVSPQTEYQGLNEQFR